MSLFKCSTPERRGVDQVLPVIANEIYLHIFELIAPSNEYLPSEEIKTFHRLSGVCRFFANVCLPRVFESVEFPGTVSRRGAPTHKASLGSMLCIQIAEEQPLALALAQAVRACHFTSSQPPLHWASRVSKAVDPLTFKKYIPAMTLMKNIRQLQASDWVVGVAHMEAIAALPSLKDLSFYQCDFPELPVGVEPEKRLKVSRLSLVGCSGNVNPLGDADMECLHMLMMDFWCLEHMWFTAFEAEDWLPQSTVTELHILITEADIHEYPGYMQEVDRVVVQMPQGLEVLCFSVDDVSVDSKDLPSIWASILGNPAWETISSLRSLTVRVTDGTLVQEGKDNLSLSVNDELPEVRRILHDKLAPGSGHTTNLRYVEFFGKVFRLVDGEWLEGAL